MGYFKNAFVSTSPVDYRHILPLVPERCLSAYKHKNRGVWLLDLWKPRRTRAHTPFCESATEDIQVDSLSIDLPTTNFIESLIRVCDSLADTVDPFDLVSVYVPLALAAATSTPMFYFAADDELTDMACLADPGSVAAFGCRLGPISIQYRSGETIITPLHCLEDDDDQIIVLEDIIDRLDLLPGISVEATREIDGGLQMYENPLRHWPAEAGDAGEILGLGTWDPFVNFDRDFERVFTNAE